MKRLINKKVQLQNPSWGILNCQLGTYTETLLHDGLSEPNFYGDLVYKFKKLIGRNDFSFHFRKIITCCRRIGYNLNVM